MYGAPKRSDQQKHHAFAVVTADLLSRRIAMSEGDLPPGMLLALERLGHALEKSSPRGNEVIVTIHWNMQSNQ